MCQILTDVISGIEEQSIGTMDALSALSALKISCVLSPVLMNVFYIIKCSIYTSRFF